MNIELIKNLESIRLNLSHYWYLEQLAMGADLQELKYSTIPATLERRGFTSDNKLTLSGKELLVTLSGIKPATSVKNIIKSTKNIREQQFDEWWSNYPSHDRIMFPNGDRVKFEETRSLRNSKPGCKLKYIKLLEEGTYTHEQLLAALKYEVEMRVSNSLKGFENKLSFMSNSKTYLHNSMFESFINMEPQTTTSKSTDTVYL